jgi:selenocysteine lyase/cysteine desulfurase
VRALPPEREETSSPNLIGAIALHAALDMLGYIGWPAITDGAGTTSPFGINGLS